MIKTIIAFIFPAIIFAGNIEIGIKKHDGISSYTVQSGDAQGLKSTLDFPLDFYTIDLSYIHKHEYFNIGIHSSFLLKDNVSKGKDYDWKNDILTVFSSSTNEIDQYYSIGLSISKSLINNIELFGNFKYQILDIYWSETYQEDYVIDKNTYRSGNTLSFEQEFYQYSFGLMYKKKFNKNILIEISPSLIYASINNKDSHIVRNFYTIQNNKAFGYGISFGTSYGVSSNSKIELIIDYQKIEDKNTNMSYYNLSDQNYANYPSSYFYEKTSIGLVYSFKY